LTILAERVGPSLFTEVLPARQSRKWRAAKKARRSSIYLPGPPARQPNRNGKEWQNPEENRGFPGFADVLARGGVKDKHNLPQRFRVK
jgi:hypothetical protein